eukprot:14962891-Ditylum_brightwellii.AAC.1
MQHNGGQYDHDKDTLMHYAHHGINLWDQLLFAIGGILESLKSGYAMMIWDFDIDGTPHLKKEKDLAPDQVTLTREGKQLR